MADVTTNLLNLPQIPAGTTIELVSNADWNDQFFVPVPGFNIAPFSLSGALAASSPTFTVASSDDVLPDMLASGFGVPAGATVDAVTATTITLSENATITAPNASVSFSPPPMDLTGISFSSKLRINAISAAVLLSCSTAAGTMTNGGTGGTFGWSVPAATMLVAPWPVLELQGTLDCVADIIATDATGATVNLCAENDPIAVTVNLSITR